MILVYEEKERKPLVNAISAFTNEKGIYLKAPTYAYRIGAYLVNRDGNIEVENGTDVKELIEYLKQNGFVLKNQKSDEDKPTLSIENSKDKVNLTNLLKINEGKKELIKKSIGITDLMVIEKETTILFDWFKYVKEGEFNAYSEFIAELCKLNIKSKRVNLIDKQIVNEKYAFRCFLLRLGFIGEKYKETRKILLKNLEGSSAFKNGGPKNGISE